MIYKNDDIRAILAMEDARLKDDRLNEREQYADVDNYCCWCGEYIDDDELTPPKKFDFLELDTLPKYQLDGKRICLSCLAYKLFNDSEFNYRVKE